MAHMTIDQASAQISAVIDLAQTEAVFLRKLEKAEAVVISCSRYEQLMSALEDLEDASVLAQMKDDIAVHGTIQWEEIRNELDI
jgi:hypothetical protein